MLEKIDHIAVAVKNLEDSLKVYRDAFGIVPSLEYESAQAKAKVAFLPVGDLRIELLQPVDVQSVMAKFLDKKGEGIHHLCFNVRDIEASLRELEEKGVELLDKKPRKVRENERVAFLNPKSTGGVLIELVQEG